MTEGIFNVTFAFYWMFVMLLRSLFFLLILLFHCAVFSQAQQAAQITAGEIFFNFVDEHTEDVEDTMGSTWFDDISKHTKPWTVRDATEFLNSLEASEFPVPHILTILKDTQFLQRVRTQEKLNGSQLQTGSDVFIDYVSNYFREKLQQNQPRLEGGALEEAIDNEMLKEMPSFRNAPLWEERIRYDARHWSVLNAILFLDDLENKWDIDTGIIIKRLNTTSFFMTNYTALFSRLEVYKEYFGKEHVKKILSKTFASFRGGKADNIKAILDFIFTYFDFEKSIMIEILSNNLQMVSNNNLEMLNRKMKWLEAFLGKGDRNIGKKEIRRVVRERKSLNIIGSVDIKRNRETEEYENETEFRVNLLRSRGSYDQEKIIELFVNNPQAFSIGDLSADKMTYLEELLRVDGRDGEIELDWVIQNKGFAGVANFKVYKNKEGQFENEYVKFLRGRKFKPVQIANLFKSNPNAFSSGDLFADKIAYLEELLEVEGRDGRAELNWVIQNKGFAGIVNFKVYENKESQLTNEYVKFLKDRGLNPKQIADLFKSNPKTFSEGDLSADKITYLEELLEVDGRDGISELDWVLQNKSFAGIVNFKIYKNKKGQFTNEYVEFLKGRGFGPVQIADMFKYSPLAFSMGDFSTDKIAYLEKYLGKGDRKKGQKKLNRIILKKGGFRALTLFKYENNGQPNRIIDFLENGMRFNQDQIIRVMEGHFSELFVEDLTKETSEDYVRRLIKKVPEICQESLSQ